MSTIDSRLARVEELKRKKQAKYGTLGVMSGDDRHSASVNAVSTGSLMWDFQTGVGGWKLGASHEVFGPFSIGKTTIAGYSALRGAQAQGMITATIATEPEQDEDWMEANGVDLGLNLLFRPDSGDEAFNILKELVYDNEVPFILFDSLGGLSSEKEQNSESQQAFGNSGLNSWGVRRLAARAWKNNIGIMYINQIRDDTKSRISGLVDSPGGHALHHAMTTRTQLKPGKDRYTIKMNDGDGNKDVMVGRQIVASFKKNKAAEGLGKSARFDYYHMHTDDYPFGFDVGKDITTAAIVSGVITGQGWLSHPILPGGKIQGKAKLYDWIAENPESVLELREEVLDVMKEREKKLQAIARDKRNKAAKDAAVQAKADRAKRKAKKDDDMESVGVPSLKEGHDA